MKTIDLNSLPYKYRFKGASLLVSKANRLSGMSSPEGGGDQSLITALAYYDMALLLLKPFDPNYSTIVNWKCNALRALGQFEEAVAWYREIVRISDEIDGKTRRNATAEAAERMIRECEGLGNEPLTIDNAGAHDFDDPPYCMFAEEFCVLLSEKKFKKAHACLSPELSERVSLAELKEQWQRMTQGAGSKELDLVLQQYMVDWPGREAGEIGWCYFSVSGEGCSEAVTVVVGGSAGGGYRVTQLAFGRP